MTLRADRRIGLLLGGVVLLVFTALAATVALPAADESMAVEDRTVSDQELRGMEVYRSEGCWYCHTQYVRGTAIDSRLGRISTPEDLGGQSPAMLGVERIGPDLRNLPVLLRNPEALARYLHGPDEDEQRTAMPSYSYLSRADLEALAEYLLSLQS